MASEGFMRSDLMASSICAFICRFSSFSSYCTEASALDDGVAFDDFLDVIAGRLVGFEEDVDLVDAAEEVVQVAHDVLVGAHQEEAEVVGLGQAVAVGVELVQRQRVAHVAQVNELVDLAVGIAGDVHQRGFARGALVQAADRHDGEQLVERPVVEQRLEDGEIAEVLVAEAVFELADFLRHVGLAFEALDHGAADLPVEVLDLGLVRQIQHAEREHVLGVLLALQRVVIGLQLVQLRQVLPDVEQLLHQRVLVLAVFGTFAGPDFLDRAEHLDDQHAVVGDDGAAAFADDVRVRHLLGVADVGDVIDDVVGVFLQRVIGRAVEGRPAAVVIHAQAAADVEVFDREAHLVQLGVKARGLLHRLLDVRMSGTCEPMWKCSSLKQWPRFSAFSISVAASSSAVLRPNLAFSPPLSAQLPAPWLSSRARMPMQRFDAELLGEGDDLAQFLQLLDDHDDLLAQLDAEHAPCG